MAGLEGLQEGGFHQRLNRLFRESDDRYLQHVKVEDKESFEEALEKAERKGKREEVLQEVRDLLLQAYLESVGDPDVLRHVRDEVGLEFERLAKESS